MRSFSMGVGSTLEIAVTLDEIICTLQKEFSGNTHIYQPFSADTDMCNPFERFLENPLGQYNENTTDFYIPFSLLTT